MTTTFDEWEENDWEEWFQQVLQDERDEEETDD